ncbi:hypothetical protein LU474_002225 [Staphylococcus pseudintermedius]|uniref:hypothetical protein n=1 Tax=Staphylococcus pseudintermedius TaxID=283734 RepID=UPI001A06CAA8|nr:hypothetical protein [Staphylococcus pseudintermedius]EGQ3902546.1 hypothetical protein [Staphylococcus pseudintermedius]EGQ3927890.1 hypothetical protein [Staphylococcus pseudintermedius]EGQ3935316.1 hypothetical protein [Staphylococcus pseudintermedius]EHP0513640.1 hypothetical protein [Staphylococcus pseudintermedius]EHT7951069.1 hypothetical protein [Staphylococcus pseudintermedius]
MLNVQIDDELINDLVDKKVAEILSTYKRTLVAVDMKDLIKMTGLSRSTLTNEITNQPEVVAVTRRIGTRVLYKYPDVIKALSIVIDRLGGD